MDSGEHGLYLAQPPLKNWPVDPWLLYRYTYMYMVVCVHYVYEAENEGRFGIAVYRSSVQS